MRKNNRAVGKPKLEESFLDMSPMIDMVFQIIIFFMVTAQLVTLDKDPKVKVTIAPKGQVPKTIKGRVLINVYSDEMMRRENLNTPYMSINKEPLEYDQITELVRAEKNKNDAAGIKPTILMLRGDKDSLVRRTKVALAAAGAAEVNDVIFSALQKEPPPKN